MFGLSTVRLAFYAAIFFTLMGTSIYLRVQIKHTDELRIQVIEQRAAIAQQQQEHDWIVSALVRDKTEAEERERQNAIAMAAILSAPHTKSCIDSPAVQRLLDQLRTSADTLGPAAPNPR